MKFLNGQIQLDSSLTGTTALFTSGLTVGSGQTSSSGIARGLLLNSNLTASANNDVLVGLDINPTFINGAFTGITNASLRTRGWIWANTGIVLGDNTGVSWNSGAPLNGLQIFPGGTYYVGSGAGFRHSFRTNANSSGGERLRITDDFTSVLNGNLLVGTTTDAGYKLDVNGTTRIRGAGSTSSSTSLLVMNSSSTTTLNVRDDGVVIIPGSTVLQGFTQIGLVQFYPVLDGGYTTSSSGRALRVDTTFNDGVSSTYGYQFGAFSLETGTASNINGTSIFITLAPTSGNKTFTTLNVGATINATGTYSGIVRGIYYNSVLTSLTGVTHRAIETVTGDVILGSTSGNVGIGTSTLGTSTELTVGGGQAASSAIARGQLLNTTLTATSNNDVLVGLDVAPTFTNGAFTGVTNWGLRMFNSVRFQTDNDLGQGIYWKPANDGTTLRIYGSTYSSSVGYLQLNVLSGNDGLVVNGGARTLTINAAGTSIALNLNNIIFNTHGTGEALRIINTTKNVLIGTTTDAGYKLDVNGTTRLGNLTLANGGILLGDVGGTRVFNTAGLAIDYGAIYPFSITGSGDITITPAGILTLKGVTHTYSATETYVVQKTTNIGHLQINFDISGSDAASYNYGTISGNVRIYPGEQSNGNGYGNVILGHNGTSSRGNVLIGTSTTNNSRLLVGGTVSGATLSTTRAVHINPTLLATGNTTTLIGLDIQPNFNRSSFTGTTALALRVSGGTQIIGSGSTGTTLSVFSVDGSSGRLFDVSDDLSSTLFSVNTIAGLPVIEAFANNAVVMGKYNQNTLVVSGTSVGIGTSSPQAKLDVSGTSIFRTGVTMNSSLILGNVDITSAWSAYTPTWTAISSNPSIGNGTITGTFKVIGKTCFVRGRITMGSSTTYGSGAWLIGLPLPAINSYAIQITSSLLNNGNAWYSGLMNGGRFGNTSYSEIQVQNTSGTADGISSTYPFTWGDTDELSFNGSYEIA